MIDVVVIDDDGSILWLMEEILNSQNIRHMSANTGRKGLELIREYNPRLAIIDIKLGGMSGLEVALEINKISASTRIIFITGYRSSVSDDVLRRPPVVGLLEKPFEVPAFLKLLDDVLVGKS